MAGHLLFYAFEAVRGRPLSERAQEIGFRIGLALVLFLMLFAAWNDILNLGASWGARGPDRLERGRSARAVRSRFGTRKRLDLNHNPPRARNLRVSRATVC